MKVAYYSPMPPERSGISDYSALLVPELRKHLDVHVQKRGRKRPPRDADVCVYHMGNNPDAHGWILEALRGWPGVVVLHELVLHHLVAGMTLARGDVTTYLDAMEREAGIAGRLLALGVVDRCIPPLWESRAEDFPLAGIVLDAATGLIVHSQYVMDGARAARFTGTIWKIPMAAWPEPEHDALDLGAGPVIGCFGHINAEKRIPQLLEAFALVRESVPNARLVLQGPVAPRFDLESRLRRLGFPEGAVDVEGYVDERRLFSLVAACDVCVNLRSPTMGETSASVLRVLSLGKPVVVTDVGWFSELPGDVAAKVPVDEREVEVLAATLVELCTDDALRETMSAAARRLVETEHSLERVGELYAAALEEAAGGEAVRDTVLAEVAQAAAEARIEPGSAEASELALRLREARLGE
jgi:glycosyltransferase involved in cell wall biosynthesis